MASSTEVSPTELATALQTLTPDEAKELFFYLKVPLHSLNSIPTNQSGNMAKISYIQLWYDNDHEASWDRIVDGLERIEKKTLAARLASQYCSRTLSSADNFTPDLPSSPVSTLEASVQATSGSSPTEPSLSPVARPSSPSGRVSEVRAEIDRFSDIFSDLMSDTRDEMCTRASVEPTFLNKFRDRVLDLPVAQKAPHTKFFRENEDDFLQAENMHKIFAILRRYSNYRNYAVLREVVRKFNSTMLQQRMNDYIKSLEHFEKATAVNVYLKAIEASDVLCAEFTKMTVKINKPAPECTLYDIRKKTEEITERASLQSYSVYIGPVLEGSVVLALGFPASCVGWILGALTPDFIATHLLSDVVLDQQPLSILNWHQENLNDELLVASKEGDVIAVASLLNSGADIHSQGNYLVYPLSCASRYGHFQVVRLLLSRYANLDYGDEGGLTALMIAVRNGRWEMIRTLLEGDLDLQEHTGGWSALHFSAENGDSTATLALVSSGANVHLPDKNFLTPLKIAAMKLENEDSRLVPEWSAYYMNDYRGERDYGTVFRLLEMSPISISVPAHPDLRPVTDHRKVNKQRVLDKDRKADERPSLRKF